MAKKQPSRPLVGAQTQDLINQLAGMKALILAHGLAACTSSSLMSVVGFILSAVHKHVLKLCSLCRTSGDKSARRGRTSCLVSAKKESGRLRDRLLLNIG